MTAPRAALLPGPNLSYRFLPGGEPYSRGHPWDEGVSDYVAESRPMILQNPHAAHEFHWATSEIITALLVPNRSGVFEILRSSV